MRIRAGGAEGRGSGLPCTVANMIGVLIGWQLAGEGYVSQADESSDRKEPRHFLSFLLFSL
jgi:hypothetical protein